MKTIFLYIVKSQKITLVLYECEIGFMQKQTTEKSERNYTEKIAQSENLTTV